MESLCEMCTRRLSALKEMPYPNPADHVYWPGPDIAPHLCAECRGIILGLLQASGDAEASNVFVPLAGGSPIYVSCRHCGRLNHKTEPEDEHCDVVYLDLAHRGAIQLPP
jgi:hypothetical protein